MKTKRLLATLLCLCMTACLLPTIAFAAETGAIQLGTGSISNGDKVYFGTYKDSATAIVHNIPWIVLENGKLSQATTTASKTLPLLSEYLLGTSPFRDQNLSYGHYSESDLQKKMNAIYNAFNSNEKAAVADATLAGASMFREQSDLAGQKLFPLSHKECEGLTYGSSILITKQIGAPAESAAVTWWQRTSSTSYLQARCVTPDGSPYGREADLMVQPHGARPAFYLNQDSVIFSSAAAGGKPNSTLTSVSGYTGNEWKLTLKDSSRKFDAVTIEKTGNVLTLYYSDASTGTNEYISAIVKDSSGNITHYGRLKNTATAADTNGMVYINLSDVGDITGKTIHIFSEQCNGDYKTDYASPLKDVAADIGEASTVPQLRINETTNEWEVSYDEGTAWTSLGIKATGADGKEIELRIDSDYIQWRYTDGDWVNLIALTALKGADGSDGADGITPQLRIDETTNEWEVSYDNGTNWTSLGVKATGEAGADAVTPQLRIDETTNEWEISYDEGLNWTSLGIKATGADGKEIELRIDSDYIQWRYTDGDWTDMIALAVLKGADGITPKLKIGTDNYWNVSYDDGVTWKSLGIMATGNNGASGQNGADGRNGADGKNGIGISSIKKTGSHGNVDTYTITLTDGTTSTFTVANGENGIGISVVKINTAGEFIVTLTDGTELNAGSVHEAVTVMSSPKNERSHDGLIVPGFIIGLIGLAGNAGWIIPLINKRRRR